MPLALEPGRIHKVVLASDRGKKDPPTFHYPFLTGRQQQTLLELYESIASVGNQSDNVRQAFKAAEMYLLGWENVYGPEGILMPYIKGNLMDVCGVIEAMQLVNKLLTQGPDVPEKKSSGLP